MFWALHGLPRWEQVAFLYLNLPFNIAWAILGLVLWIPFQLLIALVSPFAILTWVFSIAWAICLGFMLGLSWVTERWPVLRPLTFVLALPFLIVGNGFNSLIPAPTPKDVEAKIEKWDLVEAFPLTWSLAKCLLTAPSSERTEG